MRIRLVLPHGSQEYRSGLAEELGMLVAPVVELEVLGLSHAVERIDSAYHQVLVAPHLVEEVARAEREGCDAVAVDCPGDAVLRALKEAVRIPVVGVAEAGILYALALGDRFSVLSSLPETARMIEESIRARGLRERLASVRAVSVPGAEQGNHDRAAKALLAAARQAIAEDGADVVVLGHAGTPSLARGLAAELPVPVVDPAPAAIELARSLVSMGIVQSKVCFPQPRAKDGGQLPGRAWR
ncbi:MAG: aspartate/glutamate racemase family protein [Bacillota bacterium]|nr:aspartate/glutamate racemase family protein [Bacillota bacterium]